ncbi:coiled-coil domain-containing protein 102A [Planococcus citri]|uniref:coiled-coil domain-containing protein 102A n=1 Tax=Planococcus citri TaxID=170843 RepID=UPI0031F8691E
MTPVKKPNETNWETKHALHQQELEEARNRALQMEKTMRWWSDCTANWREKWSKVRNERNTAREEVKHLQVKLDSAVKENNSYRRQKQHLEVRNEQMRKELEQIHTLLMKYVGHWDSHLLESIEKFEPAKLNAVPYQSDSDEHLTCNGKDSGIEEYILNEGFGANKNHDTTNEPVSRTSIMEDTLSNISEISDDITNDELTRHRLSELQLKLNEMSKTVAAERDEKQLLHKNIEKLESELMDVKEKYEDLKVSKQEALRELMQLKDTHNDVVSHIKVDLMNETTFREDVDKRLADVRAQLERLQVENASEWGKRERLETEKLALERENKKLRTELRDTMDRLERRIKSQPTTDNELRTLQLELTDRNKELSDLKHAHLKLKKIFADKTSELNHATRRIEQYETEVKKLRSRIEELKRYLATAEEEVDANNNSIRKLQRSNDDLQEQIDNFQVQIQYLQNRLKRKSSTLQIQNRFSDEQTDEEGNV